LELFNNKNIDQRRNIWYLIELFATGNKRAEKKEMQREKKFDKQKQMM